MLLAPSSAIGQTDASIDSGASWNVNWRRIDDDDARGWSPLDQIGGPLEIGGWMSAGFTANAHGNRTGNGNAPLPANDVADAPVLNQFWVYAEKPLDMENCCYD